LYMYIWWPLAPFQNTCSILTWYQSPGSRVRFTSLVCVAAAVLVCHGRRHARPLSSRACLCAVAVGLFRVATVVLVYHGHCHAHPPLPFSVRCPAQPLLATGTNTRASPAASAFPSVAVRVASRGLPAPTHARSRPAQPLAPSWLSAPPCAVPRSLLAPTSCHPARRAATSSVSSLLCFLPPLFPSEPCRAGQRRNSRRMSGLPMSTPACAVLVPPCTAVLCTARLCFALLCGRALLCFLVSYSVFLLHDY
jgi:hypothetical protein